MRHAIRIFMRTGAYIFVVGLTWLVISIAYSLYLGIIDKQPKIQTLISLNLSFLNNNQEQITIGHRELMQNPGRDAAESEHIRIRRIQKGHYGFTNIAAQRRMGLYYKDFGFITSDSRPLAPNESFELGPHTIKVDTVNRSVSLLLPNEKESTTYTVQEQCGIQYYILAALDDLARGGNRACNVLSFGGTVENKRYVPLLGVPEDAAILTYAGGEFFLKSYRVPLIKYCDPDDHCDHASQFEWPTDLPRFGQLEHIIVGRTKYSVDVRDGTLALHTVERPHWISEHTSPENVGDTDTSRQVRQVPMKSPRRSATDACVEEIPLESLSKKADVEQNDCINPARESSLIKPLDRSLIPGWADLIFILIGASAVWVAGRTDFRAGHSHVAVQENTANRYGKLVLNAAMFWLLLLTYNRGMPAGNFVADNRGTLVGLMLVVAPIAGPFVKFTLRQIWIFAHPGPLPWLLQKRRRQRQFDPAIWILPVAAALIILWLVYQWDDKSFAPQVMPDHHLPMLALLTIHLLVGAILFYRGNGQPVSWMIGSLAAMIWISYLGLSMLGMLNLFQLTFSIDDSRYVGLFQRYQFGLATTCVCIGVTSFLSPIRLRRTVNDYLTGKRRESRLTYTAATIVVVPLLLMWTLIGGEEGVFGLQPAEFIKTLIILIFAIVAVAMLRSPRSRATTFQPWRNLTPLVNFGAILVVYALFNFYISDLSPLIITASSLLVLSILIALFSGVPDFVFRLIMRRIQSPMPSWSRYNPVNAPAAGSSRIFNSTWKRWRLWKMRGWALSQRPLEITAVLGITSAAVLLIYFFASASNEDAMIANETFIPDLPMERLLSWRDFAADSGGTVINYPDLGSQATASKALIERSGCGLVQLFDRPVAQTKLVQDFSNSFIYGSIVEFFGQLVYLDKCANGSARMILGKSDRSARSIPAIQDDFIAAFFIHTFGRDTALFLLFLQFTLFSGMLGLAAIAILQTNTNPQEYDLHAFLSITLAGFAFYLFFQFFFSWSNVFGIMPIMGQPMSLMSAGTSHLLFFVMPAMLAAFSVGRLLSTPLHSFGPRRQESFLKARVFQAPES